jgi:hypothetical protein
MKTNHGRIKAKVKTGDERFHSEGISRGYTLFAFLSHLDRSTIDPLDLSQWRFYVVSTATLDARTAVISAKTAPLGIFKQALRTLEGISGSPVVYEDIRALVARLAGQQNRSVQDDPAPGNQPLGPETNRTSAAAGSRR